MNINIIGDKSSVAYQKAAELIKQMGYDLVYSGNADLQIAPLLTKIVPYPLLAMPKYGTLIFHPSPLPYGRGAASIKYAYKRGEPITAATWFWANNEKVDSGDICESEIVKIDYCQRPREFYNQHIIPAMLRTLERALKAIDQGYIRRVSQVDEYASFDYK